MKRQQEIDDVIDIVKAIKDTPLHFGYRPLLNGNCDHAIQKLESLKTLLNTNRFWE